MKTIILVVLGASALLFAAGCDEGHEHHGGHYGGTYDGSYQGTGHEQWPGYPAREGYWDRTDDWHPH